MLKNILTIHSVNPTGMFSYGLSGDVKLLNKGLVSLVGVNEDKGGDSNGSGKSSLFNAICEMLFQENPTGVKGDDVVNSVWGRGMAGRVLFTTYRGDHYRVTYCRGWRDSTLYPADNDTGVSYVGTSLYLDKYEDGVWKDKRGSGMPQTHLLIGEVIGMTYEQFLSIAYMSGRIGDRFIRGSNKDRMDILSSVSGVEEWDLLLNSCRERKKALTTQISQIDQRIAFERGSAQTLKEQLQSAKAFNWDAHIRGLEDRLGLARTAWKEQDDKASLLKEQVAELRKQQGASVDQAKIDEINSQIADLNKKIRDKEKSLSANLVIDDPAILAELALANNLLSQAKGVLASYSKSGSILTMDVCPTCEGKISKEKKGKIQKKIDDVKEEIRQHEESCEAVKSKLEEFRKSKKAKIAEDAQKTRGKIEVLRKEIEGKNEELGHERMRYVEFDVQIGKIYKDLTGVQAEMSRYQTEGQEIKKNIEQAKTSVEQIKTLEGQVEDRMRQVKHFEAEIAGTKEDLEVYVWLIDNIPFIKLHKMSVTMAEVSDLANQFFAEIGDSVRVSITSFEEKAKKKNAADIKDLLKSEIRLEVTDGSKNISPRLYSDGETSKISLGIIKALHELANKTGQGCNIMMLDEIFSYVDAHNSQRIAAIMSRFVNKGTVFLTDNSGSVQDLIKFDRQWVARKRDGQTLLESD